MPVFAAIGAIIGSIGGAVAGVVTTVASAIGTGIGAIGAWAASNVALATVLGTGATNIVSTALKAKAEGKVLDAQQEEALRIYEIEKKKQETIQEAQKIAGKADMLAVQREQITTLATMKMTRDVMQAPAVFAAPQAPNIPSYSLIDRINMFIDGLLN